MEASSWDSKLILKMKTSGRSKALNAELMVGTNNYAVRAEDFLMTLYASGGYTRS